MTARLITDADLQPGARLQYPDGTCATVIHVRESASGMYEVATWSDRWGGEDGEHPLLSWSSRAYLVRFAVVVDPSQDPNPHIHERWVVRSEED